MKFTHLLQSATLVLPITSSLQDYLIGRYHLNSSKCFVVPNAIEHQEIQVNESSVQTIKKEFNLGEKTVVGFVGSIFPYHGVERLIHAAAKISNNNIALLIVGDGFLIPDLKKLSNELGISASVHFTGSVSKENVYHYMATMDILTLPNTEWYCSPVKLFEYGALGKPILAVKEAGVSDVMTSEQGVLFDNNDQSFEEALEYAVENLSLLDQKAIAFQKKILQQHSWRANAANILQHLNSQS